MCSRIRTCLASVVGIVLAFGQPAAADILTLSDFSSDETPAADLNATLDFSVSDSTLTLTVTNDTSTSGGFDINAVYFNAASNVTGLTPNPAVTGWMLSSGQSADGFGVFDFALIDGVGNDPAQIGPQGSQTFTFDISRAGSILDTDFTIEFSTIPPGDHPALAAAKFVNGPNDDSAFGAVVPAPSAAVLGVLGVVMVGYFKRRFA